MIETYRKEENHSMANNSNNEILLKITKVKR